MVRKDKQEEACSVLGTSLKGISDTPAPVVPCSSLTASWQQVSSTSKDFLQFSRLFSLEFTSPRTLFSSIFDQHLQGLKL